jgi:hypothetical protein
MAFARASREATISFRAFSAASWTRRGSESTTRSLGAFDAFEDFASGFGSDDVVLGTTDVYHGRGG